MTKGRERQRKEKGTQKRREDALGWRERREKREKKTKYKSERYTLVTVRPSAHTYPHTPEMVQTLRPHTTRECLGANFQKLIKAGLGSGKPLWPELSKGKNAISPQSWI